MTFPGENNSTENPRAPVLEVFLAFLRLGCTSFGGPIAHLSYFQRELVERRKWCSSNTLAEIIALAQSLPGPASSQVSFALGILRAGLPGGLAAWLGFTLPSAILMLTFALAIESLSSTLSAERWQGALHGLQLVAVAVIAQAILSMRRTLAPDLIRVAFALLAAALVLFVPVSYVTLIAIAVAGSAGLLLFQNRPQPAFEPLPRLLPKSTGIAAASLFVALLLLSAVLTFIPATRPGPLAVFSAFYRAGALVFGGGHVVLPLLQNTVVAPGWVTLQSFLSGYGAAQALPGPLFSFAAYLGALTHPAATPSASPILYGVLALIGLFAPRPARDRCRAPLLVRPARQP